MLVIIIYVVGVMLRQVIETYFTKSVCDDAAQSTHLCEYKPQMFSSIFRSMFTVFRCLIDGCSSADGTPLILYFWDELGSVVGPLFVLFYVLVMVFIMFGVFNLIMAIFVEKTLEYAKQDTAKRREARYKEEVRVAKDLRTLILKICAHQQGVGDKTNRKTTAQQNVETFMSGFKFAFGGGDSDTQPDIDSSRSPASTQLTINRENFDSIMNEADIRSRMEDLDISVTSSAKLFDILDSNNSGAVDVIELTEGLMSLRGPADKGDIISGSLLVKSTQKMIKDMQVELTKCVQNQNRQFELLRQLDAKFKSRLPSENRLL